MINTYGSVCSGIEAASFVLEPLGVKPLWLSEIAEFPKRFLATNYAHIKNLGDMNDIPEKVKKQEIEAPDLLCGGTPCQAFSLAGWKNGLNDDRGQLTLKYIEILNEIDAIRDKQGKQKAIFFWENVEGVLKDKTNAFGCFLAGLLGLDEPIIVKKWSNAGIVYGKDRNIAWRVLDSKYFGVAQQRKRLYVIGGGKDFHPECVLFEVGDIIQDPILRQEKKQEPVVTLSLSLFDEPNEEQSNFDTSLTRNIDGHEIEVFRTYSDCLYAAYGTKWNGNAAAFNGSLYVAQDGKLRRLTPLECERLMGFPDNYTLLPNCRDTQRYQAIGNSWAVPVVQWLIQRIVSNDTAYSRVDLMQHPIINSETMVFVLDDFTPTTTGQYLNASRFIYDYKLSNMLDVVDVNAPEKFYISPQGCAGILRRKREHNAGMNARLEQVLENCVK